VEIPLSKGMNVIVGPNGSGKSNISDAICFVLGRLSVKSMRAAKASNLLFVGSKQIKPAFEASVKIVFDNSDKSFPLPDSEVSIERKVRRNGQSIYKINNEIKTRQEVIELLSQGNIDPYGFNIVLQGEISSIVKMPSEDRRKIIEDAAGISVYEDKKQKSLRELEKTEEDLKQVGTILRERGIYLKNLEEERKQALRFKELEASVKNLKASILFKKITEKRKELESIESEIEKKEKLKAGQKLKLEQLQNEISSLEQEISRINEFMYKSGGIEQETLKNEITELKSELSGLFVRKENNEQKLDELLRKRKQMESSIKELELELGNLRKKSPELMQKSKEMELKRKHLEELERLKKEHYKLKSELELVKIRLSDKKQELKTKEAEINSIINETNALAEKLSFSELPKAKEHLGKLKQNQALLSEKIENANNGIMKLEKELSAFESEISNLSKLKKQVSELDICPVCKSKITPEHINKISSECNEKAKELSFSMEKNTKEIEKLKEVAQNAKAELSKTSEEMSKISIEIIKLENSERRKEQIKQLHFDTTSLNSEIKELEKRKSLLEKKAQEFGAIDEKYDALLLDIKELSSRNEENVDAEIKFKEMDVEKTRNIIRQSFRDEENLKDEILELQQNINEKSSVLREKEKAGQELNEKFKKLIEKRESLQKDILSKNGSISELRHLAEVLDNSINEIKINRAKTDAEIKTLDFDLKQFENAEIIQGSFESLQYKLDKAQNALNSITGVNLRALEVYEQVKSEYDVIAQKAEQLNKEKEEILKVISEIDKKKKRAFMKTLNEINHHFTENFTRLSTKGQAYLELENPEDPFSGGVDIVVRIAKGKYFDVKSLSGGEQTLIAISLLFAIQKYKPYSFYIFDEIDAALDKRNSEILATLIKQNTEKGQHLLITHNDALISSSDILYGVSMQDGVSKLISLEL